MRDIAHPRWHSAHPTRAPAASPIIADPTFMLPHDTPDARWHLFAYSIWGVHRFTPTDGIGIRWLRPRLAVHDATRCRARRETAGAARDSLG